MMLYSLYLHIPFCRHRCSYCDFNTYAGMENLMPDYVHALCQEIRWVAASAGERLNVHTVFFGGGTPSLLPLAEIARIFQAVERAFCLTSALEVTLEANPGTVSLDYLRGLKALGINRLSLGMQSALPHELRLLERQHQLEDVIQAVSWARQAGLENVNLDLIFGLPHQSLEDWEKTLRMALSLKPDHLSLYALTLEHGTPMAQWVQRGLLAEPDGDLAADMVELACEYLSQAGFQRYEISNWAKIDPDGTARVCRHNLQYWKLLPYLGIGAGAHGFANGMRTANVLSPAGYIRALKGSPEQNAPSEHLVFPCGPAVQEIHVLDTETLMGEYMLMGLRLVEEGVSCADFQARFQQDMRSRFAPVLEKHVRLGLLEWVEDGQRLRLTQRGRLLGNLVFQEFV